MTLPLQTKKTNRMRQKIQHIVTLLLLLPLFFACQEELPFAPATDGSYLSLSLATQAITRATENGEDAFNENKIERADVYFFPTTAETDGNQTCIYAQLDLHPSPNGGDNTLYTLQVPLNKTVISDGTSYYVYVVANHDFGYTVEPAKNVTLDDIKEQTITTVWKSGYTSAGTGETDVEKVKESSLVMDGGEQITIQDNLEKPETIDMTRAMAKVTLSASTEETIESNGLTYTPIPRGMFATLVYGVKSTNLAAGDYALNAEKDYVIRMRRNYNDTYEEVTMTNGETRRRYSQVAPFYSYPNPKNTVDRKDSYLILCVPWMAMAADGTSYQSMNYYYRVPITGTGAPAELERNHYYKINVHIGVLGSLNPYEAVELKADFEIIDWFEVGIDADIQQYQYLVLDEYSSVLNNVAEIEMPYISSSPLNMAGDDEYTRVISMTYWDYSPRNDDNDEAIHVFYGERSEYDENYQDKGYAYGGTLPSDIHLEERNGRLYFEHVLTDDDYVAITFTVVVFNTQGVESDRWTITQYPGMYIDGYFNTEGASNRFINGFNGTSGTARDDGENGWNPGGGNSLSSISNWSGTNSNRHLYTIYISSFDVGDKYAIGDPRSESHYKFNGRIAATEYRETREDAEDVIAPAFMVASSWGKTQPMSYETARKRCAAYQEGGYPAGRWRVPTKAEVEYIVGLSQERKIPRLFGQDRSTTNYWVSSGVYNTSNGYTAGRTDSWGDDRSAYLRCVYDVWYWGEQTIEEDDEHNTSYPRLTNEDFVWGDAEDGSLTRGREH